MNGFQQQPMMGYNNMQPTMMNNMQPINNNNNNNINNNGSNRGLSQNSLDNNNNNKKNSTKKNKKKKNKKKRIPGPPKQTPLPMIPNTNGLMIPNQTQNLDMFKQTQQQMIYNNNNGINMNINGNINNMNNINNNNNNNDSDTSENDDFKLKDGDDLQHASDIIKKKKKKKNKNNNKHKRFDSRNEFLKRRGVSGVPLAVQKKLAGIDDNTQYASSHLKLIALDGKITSKSPKTAKFLYQCLKEEVLFKGMDDKSVNEIVNVMYRVNCPKGENIIKQNEYGDAYFVIERGLFNIIHEEIGLKPKIVGEMKAGSKFGEGSLLYSIPRAATLTATKSSVVWALDADKFVEVRDKLSKGVNDKTAKKVKALQKLPLFDNYHQQDLVSIAGKLKEMKFKKNDKIVIQGNDSDLFYIIKTGTAVAIKEKNNGVKQEVKEYSDGDFFGERGLIKNEKRAATVIAKSTVKCYVFNKSDFHQLFKNSIDTFNQCIKGYDEDTFKKLFNSRFKNLVKCKLKEFIDLGILGVGSFGRVSLVKDPKTGKTYSLKKVKKNKVIETGQQEHVRNERAVLAILDSEFCCRMYGTYQDPHNIYFLMEPVLGGELFTVLRWNKRFSEKTARFYAACVVLGFEHLHTKNIIYRDLKPENLLIHKNGYCKIVDFGFAKRRNNSCTLCGTPEYLSPEVIQNWPQGFGVDWWALGIFIYEMVIGNAPFQDDPNVKMYEKILTYDVQFPKDVNITDRCKDLILRLLNKDAYKRLGSSPDGASHIQKHVWFQGLDWNKMKKQDVTPPYKPNIEDEEDVSNYDNYPEEEAKDNTLKDDAEYEWCEDF